MGQARKSVIARGLLVAALVSLAIRPADTSRADIDYPENSDALFLLPTEEASWQFPADVAHSFKLKLEGVDYSATWWSNASDASATGQADTALLAELLPGMSAVLYFEWPAPGQSGTAAAITASGRLRGGRGGGGLQRYTVSLQVEDVLQYDEMYGTLELQVRRLPSEEEHGGREEKEDVSSSSSNSSGDEGSSSYGFGVSDGDSVLSGGVVVVAPGAMLLALGPGHSKLEADALWLCNCLRQTWCRCWSSGLFCSVTAGGRCTPQGGEGDTCEPVPQEAPFFGFPYWNGSSLTPCSERDGLECLAGKCTAPQCDDDAGCPAGQHCSDDTRRCEDEAKSGELCTPFAEDSSGGGDSGGDGDNSGGACADGLACDKSGTCREPECGSGQPCGEGQFCDFPLCADRLQEKQPCKWDDQCADGMVCLVQADGSSSSRDRDGSYGEPAESGLLGTRVCLKNDGSGGVQFTGPGADP